MNYTLKYHSTLGYVRIDQKLNKMGKMNRMRNYSVKISLFQSTSENITVCCDFLNSNAKIPIFWIIPLVTLKKQKFQFFANRSKNIYGINHLWQYLFLVLSDIRKQIR